MRDSEVVAAIVAGDPAGLAEAYDRYAAPLYTYCRTLLREPADAADAVQDTFVIAASRLSALRDPERLRSWLYAVARNECHRRLRGGMDYAPLEEAPDVTDESANVPSDTERAELRALVNAALGGVGPAEREVLELQLRQGLVGGEVAEVLGVARNHAHALLSRARDQLHTSLGVLLVARTGRQDCPGLDALLKDWDGQLTVLVRKRVNRHIERCPVCSDRRRRELAPAMFLGIAPIVALPAVAASLPPGLRDQVLRAATSHPPGHPVPLTKSGFPKPLHPPKARWLHEHPLQAGAAAAAGVAGLAVATTVIATPPHHDALSGSGGPSATASAIGPAGASAPGGNPSGTGGATGTGAAGGPAGASGTNAAGGRSPAASGGATGGTTGGPSGGATSTGTATGNPTATASAAPSANPGSSAAAGALSVNPTTLILVLGTGGTLTLTASGGPVTWSISEPFSLIGKLVISPSSGTLAAGASTTVTVSVSGLLSLDAQLTVEPGGTAVTVLLGTGLLG
jgi:RNA polymerase sigma factor (sigma-70 family)